MRGYNPGHLILQPLLSFLCRRNRMNHRYNFIVTLHLLFYGCIWVLWFWLDSSKNIANTDRSSSASYATKKTPSMASSSLSSRTIIYNLLEEGNKMNNSEKSFIRYGAFYNDEEGTPVSIFEWAQTVATSEQASIDFIAYLSQTAIKSSDNNYYEAYYFETKGCSSLNYKKKSFEFVLVNAPILLSFVRREGPCAHAFQAHFSTTTTATGSGDPYAVAFPNLSGDARLIAPAPRAKDTYQYYSHLATFVRGLPMERQVTQLIQMVAEEYLQRVKTQGANSVWLSTSGTGISWLHFRLDSFPKYYQFQRFKKET